MAQPPPAGESPEEELARLREENAQLRFENALVKGSLATHQGAPLDWPADLPELLREEGFSARVSAAAAAIEGLDLVDIDCSEYPCLAVLRSQDTEPGWEDQARAVPDALSAELGEGYGTMMMARGEDDGDEPVMMMAFALVPSEEGEALPQDQATRIGYRAEEAMTAATDEVREAEPR